MPATASIASVHGGEGQTEVGDSASFDQPRASRSLVMRTAHGGLSSMASIVTDRSDPTADAPAGRWGETALSLLLICGSR
jgi:hypothetical protein